MTHIGACECSGDSITTIGQGEYLFNIELSLAGQTSEWIYSKSDTNMVVCVCELPDQDIPVVLKESDYQFSSEPTQIHLDKWVLVRNVQGHIAAIRLTAISGNHDRTHVTVKFVYAIFEVLTRIPSS